MALAVTITALLAMCAAGRAHALPRRSAHSGGARAPDLRHRLQRQTINETCPRFATVRLAPHGAGHVFFDIVAGIDLAHRLNATYVLDDAHDLRDLNTIHGRGVFDGMLDVLNVKQTEHSAAYIGAAYNPTHANASYDDAPNISGCNTFVTVSDQSCTDPRNVTQRIQYPGQSVFCQNVLDGLYQSVRPIFMAKFVSSPLRLRSAEFFNARATNIAWHVRTGDADLLSDRPAYFETYLTRSPRVAGHCPSSAATTSFRPWAPKCRRTFNS